MRSGFEVTYKADRRVFVPVDPQDAGAISGLAETVARAKAGDKDALAALIAAGEPIKDEETITAALTRKRS